MKANLSIVLDENKVRRLDLLQDVPLSSIDQYTTLKSSSSEIRDEYKQWIDSFLKQHQPYINQFQKDSNRQGSLVIVYEDERKRLHRMRVLYKENQNKLDINLVLQGVCAVIRNQKNPDFTIELIKNFDFFLGSPYTQKVIRKIQAFPSTEERVRANQNQRLVNLIRNKILDSSARNFETGYFYLRLIDSYLERRKLQTTKRTINTKYGQVEYRESSLQQKATLQEHSPYTNSKPTWQNYEYKLEEDGQYALFDTNIEEPRYLKYEHFLENQEESQISRRKK